MAWPSLLRGLGFVAVQGLEPAGTPHAEELRMRLDREGWWAAADGCRWPAAGAVRLATATCIARFEPPVLAAVKGGAAWCWAQGRWHAAVGYDGVP